MGGGLGVSGIADEGRKWGGGGGSYCEEGLT